jgi:hypothetical protein
MRPINAIENSPLLYLREYLEIIYIAAAITIEDC